MPGHGLQARGIAREQKMIYAGMTLFLEQGYERTTTAQIARKAGMSPASFFAAFENKEALLLRLTQIMFRSQFSRAEKMLPADQSPLLLYAMETGLQLHIAECSEPLRDLYVTAYSLPSTSDFINRSMTPRLRQIFSRWMKRADDSELFELELASAGVTRSYMSISDCAPDVILAAYSGFSEEEYNMLSQIAPTVAYPSVAWSTTWREETIVDATAMGMKSEGEALVAETDAMIQKKLAEYPAIEGKKAAFFWLSASDLSTFYIYTTLDPRAAFLTDLGMPLPDSVAALDNGKDFALTVSAENANQFSDVEIIITYGTDELLTALQADPLLSEISAVKNGAVVLLDSSDDLAASSTPSILSIPYTIDRYLEVLNAAAEKAV